MCEVVCEFFTHSELFTHKKQMCAKVVYFQKNVVKIDLLLQKIVCYLEFAKLGLGWVRTHHPRLFSDSLTSREPAIIAVPQSVFSDVK